MPSRRLLLLRAGALGDLLLIRPALTALRAAGRSVDLVAPAAGALLGPAGLREVDGWIAWDDPRLLALHAGAEGDDGLARRLQTYEAALAWIANLELVESLRRFVPDVRVLDPTRLPGLVHASVSLARPALDLVGGAFRDAPTLEPDPADEAALSGFLARLPPRFLALHPGSGAPAKNWPADRFAALATRLTGGLPYLVVEGPADAEAVAGAAGPKAVLAHGLTLRALGGLLGRAGLYVGNDSGISHLAAAFGAPTVALFGPTDPVVWAPRGPRVATLGAPGGRLAALEVRAVAEAAAEALRSWGRPGPPSG